MEVMHERIAGLDLHKAMIVVCVRRASSSYGPTPVDRQGK
jgi:hypothetical protein